MSRDPVPVKCRDSAPCLLSPAAPPRRESRQACGWGRSWSPRARASRPHSAWRAPACWARRAPRPRVACSSCQGEGQGYRTRAGVGAWARCWGSRLGGVGLPARVARVPLGAELLVREDAARPLPHRQRHRARQAEFLHGVRRRHARGVLRDADEPALDKGAGEPRPARSRAWRLRRGAVDPPPLLARLWKRRPPS